ncbi:acyltransferase [Xylophilus sp. GOD-11R]|uniref:acyltransferase family protein n=1 Tax=Xylophilus sp. GOD-11R TaxID=3089814 RepID=UPI00298C1C5D|nr:acyltransferase [Xylophilus sp. GOD-11R]WPB55212.1 acyltransferase [Xylophilus sp. GOD-11R]
MQQWVFFMALGLENSLVLGLSLCLAWLSIYFILRFTRIVDLERPGIYPTIDGLRGYLALSVAVYHGMLWLQFRGGRVWSPSESWFLEFVGTGSVAIFFMITAFLFVGKILESKATGRPLSWNGFFVGRLFRLTPLYLSVILLMLVATGISTHWVRNESLFALFKHIAHWLLYGIAYRPLINEFAETHYITAGVMWTLPYEWMFYLLMPLIALMLLRRKQPLLLVCITVCLGVFILSRHHKTFGLMSFVFGASAAYLVRSARVKIFCTNRRTLLIPVFLVLLSLVVRDLYFVAICAVFLWVVCGVDPFGMFTNKCARALGQISYSIYLIHGLVLFALFWSLGGRNNPDALGHLIGLFAAVPVIVLLRSLMFRLIESPGIKMGQRLRSSRPRRDAQRAALTKVGSPID